LYIRSARLIAFVYAYPDRSDDALICFRFFGMTSSIDLHPEPNISYGHPPIKLESIQEGRSVASLPLLHYKVISIVLTSTSLHLNTKPYTSHHTHSQQSQHVLSPSPNSHHRPGFGLEDPIDPRLGSPFVPRTIVSPAPVSSHSILMLARPDTNTSPALCDTLNPEPIGKWPEVTLPSWKTRSKRTWPISRTSLPTRTLLGGTRLWL
jgi:hypothetical protein